MKIANILLVILVTQIIICMIIFIDILIEIFQN